MQLSDFDQLTSQLIDQAERRIEPYLNVEHTNSRLALREKQLQELNDAMRNLNPKDVLLEQYAEEVRCWL